jgi:hypothetical protein
MMSVISKSNLTGSLVSDSPELIGGHIIVDDQTNRGEWVTLVLLIQLYYSFNIRNYGSRLLVIIRTPRLRLEFRFLI